VPRRRTELLVQEAAALAPAGAVVVDLCCGSGAIGAALAAAELHAADLDPAAVRCARANLPEAQVYEGDLYGPLPENLKGRVDVIAANVPYVPSAEIALLPAEAREHEPRMALDGGADGLDLLRRVAAEAPAWLAPRGALLSETSEDQAPAAAEILAGAGLEPRVARSTELDATVVVGVRMQP
jgi:release factor glutamine methyltransferase